MSLSPAPSMELLASVTQLVQRGFAPVRTYGDGVVLLAKPLPNGDESIAWITEDGLVRAPHLRSDYRAHVARKIVNKNASIEIFDTAAA